MYVPYPVFQFRELLHCPESLTRGARAKINPDTFPDAGDLTRTNSRNWSKLVQYDLSPRLSE